MVYPQYAHIVRPLNLLTSDKNASKMVDWNEECHQAFDKLKKLCTNTPVLVYVDYSKQFQVHINISALFV